jgi:hypothetical protein
MFINLTQLRARVLLLAVGIPLAVAAASWLIVQPTAAAPEPKSADASTAAAEQAVALRGAPTVAPDPSARPEPLSVTEARAYGAQLAKSIPLPPLGTFDDLHWAGAGGMAKSDIEGVMEFHAACAWYQYVLAAGGVGDNAAKVLDAIGKWPTFRANPRGAMASSLASAAVNGDTATLSSYVDVNCRQAPPAPSLQP